MSRSKSHWRAPAASDPLADPESAGGSEYASPGSQARSFSYLENGQNSKSQTARNGSTSTKSRRSSSTDAEFEEDEQWNEGSDDDSKRKSKKRAHPNDRLMVSFFAHHDIRNTQRLSALQQKRRDQNRVSQRAFSQRKERHTKELEVKVEELETLLEAASHENSIVHSQMGRMEEELCYYRRLLFIGTRQNRLPLTPLSCDGSQPAYYTSNSQQFKISSYSTTGLQDSTFSTTPQLPIATPYLASYHATLAANSSTSGIPSPHPTENHGSSFGSHRCTTPSIDSCSTRQQTPARSCSPSAESQSPQSPFITSPVPHYPNVDSFGTNVGGAFWDLDISGFNVSGKTFGAAGGGQDGVGYLPYSAGWAA